MPVQADLADVVERHPASVQVGFGYQNGQLGMIRNIRGMILTMRAGGNAV